MYGSENSIVVYVGDSIQEIMIARKPSVALIFWVLFNQFVLFAKSYKRRQLPYGNISKVNWFSRELAFE